VPTGISVGLGAGPPLRHHNLGWGLAHLCVTTTLAASPFAPFEKWPAAQSTPAGGPAFPLPAAGLTPTSNNDSDLHAQGVQHRIDGFKARMCARTQGFVQALPTKAGVCGDLRHASRSKHFAERGRVANVSGPTIRRAISARVIRAFGF
jgi:hypothetical protein